MKKYYQYLKYVIRHKWFVFLECRKVGMYWRGVVHDMSKFLPSEFIPYARFFYGRYPKYEVYEGTTLKPPSGLFKEDVKRHFDKAWLKHIHRNPHHWQYWLLQEVDGPLKIIPMPMKYLKEMLCDWHGAGMAITGKNNTADWYLKNKDKIKLGRIHHKWIERQLGLSQATKEGLNNIIKAIS